MPESVFMETTILSYYVARSSTELVQAARQELTIDWWQSRRGGYDLFTSQAVLDEVTRGDPQMADASVGLLKEIPLLAITDAVIVVAESLITKDIIPEKAADDALHISCAAVHEMDYLLTWNCRHIANPHNQRRIRAVLENHGHDMPVICTPEEFMESE
jgi:predicted nucleic acid-binding protein